MAYFLDFLGYILNILGSHLSVAIVFRAVLILYDNSVWLCGQRNKVEICLLERVSE